MLHRVLNLDEDLSGFYEAAAADPELAWATTGASRMLRSPTVFEEVVNTTCSCTHRSHDTGPREGRSALGEPGFERGGPNRTAFKQ